MLGPLPGSTAAPFHRTATGLRPGPRSPCDGTKGQSSIMGKHLLLRAHTLAAQWTHTCCLNTLGTSVALPREAIEPTLSCIYSERCLLVNRLKGLWSERAIGWATCGYPSRAIGWLEHRQLAGPPAATRRMPAGAQTHGGTDGTLGRGPHVCPQALGAKVWQYRSRFCMSVLKIVY